MDKDHNGRVTCQLTCIDTKLINEVWPHIEHLIKAAMERGRISDFAVVKRDLYSGGALLWIAWNDKGPMAAAVTQCAIANGEKCCTITACGGENAKEWLPLIAGLEHYARQENCRAMRIMGRKGWKRMLPDYHEIGFILERTL